MSAPRPQKPLELILARNLLTSISTPGFLLDSDAAVVFYNEAAAALLGRTFEEAGRMEAEQWTEAFGPFDVEGSPVEVDALKTTEAIRAGRPAHATFTIMGAGGEKKPIEASAFPIVASEEGSSGAMVLFWPLSDNGGPAS
jgi:PAS domain-containing protein